MTKLKYEYFKSDTCGACQMVTPIVEEFIAKGNKVDIINTSADESDREYAKSVNVTSLPTFIIYDENNNEIKRVNGFFAEIPQP